MNVIYLRTSTEDQNPEQQLREVQSIAPPDSIIYREQQSAWKDHHKNRPIFKTLYDSVKQGKVKTFSVWDLDRIYRKRLRTVAFMKLCKVNSCTVLSYRQAWLKEFDKMPPPWDEIVQDLLINIFGWIAEEESIKTSERIKRAYREHKGKKWGRPKIKANHYELLRLRDEGKSIREIAKITGLSRSKVHICLKSINHQKGQSFINETPVHQ